MDEDQLKQSIEKATSIARKYGAPKEEAFCLALFQLGCGMCKKYHGCGGECKGIWDNRNFADYEHFRCSEFDTIEK